VIIHVHLKNPIIIGTRKTKDVQFYREATDVAFDETGNRKRKHRYGDDEEFEQEQEERRRRAELDRQFKAFAEKISDAGRESNISVDIPFKEISFHGVPYRSNVVMAPATDALVQLTEPPFTVITLEEVEVAHLERVQVRALFQVFEMTMLMFFIVRPQELRSGLRVQRLPPRTRPYQYDPRRVP
jgi:nucleosome binding factor SPN SPT16 subunit